jgi:hypothetical protein
MGVSRFFNQLLGLISEKQVISGLLHETSCSEEIKCFNLYVRKQKRRRVKKKGV